MHFEHVEGQVLQEFNTYCLSRHLKNGAKNHLYVKVKGCSLAYNYAR